MAVKTVEVIIDSQTYLLRWDSTSQSYKATVTAPNKSSYNQPDHYYPVTIRAIDDAGNVAVVDHTDPELGSKCRLRVVERVLPEISARNPTDSSTITTNTPPIEWFVTDNDSGIDLDSISIRVDGGNDISEGIQKTPVDDGYLCTYSQTFADGEHHLTFNVRDHDGNSASLTTVFKVDTTPPELVVEYPPVGLITNVPQLTITGRTSDHVSSPVTLEINDNSVTILPDGTFSHTYDLDIGTNEIRIVATDAIGKTSIVERTVVLDVTPPTFSEVELSPNPADAGMTFVITVRVSDQ